MTILHAAIIGLLAVIGFLCGYLARSFAHYIDAKAKAVKVAGVPLADRINNFLVCLTCDCGNASFFKFGPYHGSERDLSHDDGLRMIYTCDKCGDQLRIYQASKMEVSHEGKG